jgi:amino acid adenylation domain-containing protein
MGYGLRKPAVKKFASYADNSNIARLPAVFAVASKNREIYPSRESNVAAGGMTTKPHSPLSAPALMTAEETHRLLVEWNDTKVPFAADTCIHEFFEAQIAKTPDAPAVAFRDQQWTYRELNDRANALARKLQSAGVGPGTFVAVCLNRSFELVAALLAILKAGGAYVPLDPSYPAERLAFMIDDAKPAVIVVSKKTEKLFESTSARLVLVDDAANEKDGASRQAAPVRAQSDDSAYVLYTSGSTGKPKGVVVTHRNVANFFTAMDAVIGTEVGVWLAVTSVNFDISVFELFWTLARGFLVVVQEEGQWLSHSGSVYSLPEQMKRYGVTHLQCTPSLATLLLGNADSLSALKQLKRLMVGGEPLPFDLGHRLDGIIEGQLFNLYGPTETTVWSSAQRITAEDKKILIGRPIANTQMYLLDPERHLVHAGTVGELYIGGEGVTREYLHQPGMTAERFITHTFAPDRIERLYRTGDLARHQPDGRIEFMGRVDEQVKIRGVRIELGEIEVVLREHPDVRDAVVVVREDDSHEKYLAAYVISSTSAAASVDALENWLSTKLPRTEVPSTFVFLSEFPTTPNGKLDRRALPKPQPAIASSQTASHDLEQQLAAIWCDVLDVKSVEMDDRFFAIGGHSLQMVEVHDQLRDKLGLAVALLDLFQYPTIRTLAAHLREQSPVDPDPSAGASRGQLRKQSALRQETTKKVS